MTKKKISNGIYLFTLGMLCAFAPMCSDMYLPALPMLMEYFNTNPATVQMSLTASFIGLAVGQLFIGPISDTYGRIKPLYVSLVLFTLSSYFCAISPNVEIFIFCRILQGISAAGGIVLTRAIACDKYHGVELTSFMSFLMAINSLGPILGPIVGSFVLSISTWQTIFYILVVWGILLLVLSKGFVDETLVVEKRAKSVIDSLRQMKTDILNLKFMLTAISLSFIMGGFFSYLAASPFVFQVIYPLTGCENTAL